jgi:hypothetical protein
VLAHEIRNRLQLAQRFRLHRFDFLILVEHHLQLALPAAHVPDRLGLVEPKVPLLNDVPGPRGLPGKGPGLQCQRQRVNGLPGRMQQEPGDIQSPLLVSEDRFPAFKNHFPEAPAPAQGILGILSWSVVSSQWSRCHSTRVGVSH